MAERVYAKKSAEGQASQAGDEQAQESAKPADDGVVDAEFEEVKEDKK